MFTVRFVGDVVSPDMKNAFERLAKERRLKPRRKAILDYVDANGNRLQVIDWRDLVRVRTFVRAALLARFLREQLPGSEWEVATVDDERGGEPDEGNIFLDLE